MLIDEIDGTSVTLLDMTPRRGARGTLDATEIGPKAIPDKESGMRVIVSGSLRELVTSLLLLDC